MDPSGDAARGRLLDGRYRVGAVIARGGMSTVFRGVDTRLDRPVAIKIMQPSYAGDPSFLARFTREARMAATLHHPGVVAVYDQGQDGDTVFLVMELVDGGTLRDLLRQEGALDVPVAMSVLEPLLAALGAAHAAGLVHRDVKPENVLISGRGEVKVADFGLVRAVSSQTMATGDVILGTVAYLSPEQVATGASDVRSDVYSAGIVAYEMLTGAAPFTGDNAISVAYQHVHSSVPPVTDAAPGVPVELDDLILAATRRDPDQRPRDASAFLASLRGVRHRLGVRPVRTPTPRAPGHRVTSGGTVVAAPVAGRAAPTRTAASPTMVRDDRAHHQDAATQWAGSRTLVPGTVSSVRPVQKSRHPLRRWVILVLVVLLLGAAAALSGWWLGSGRWAYIPRTVGITRTAAESMVRDAGLVPAVSTAPDNLVPSGAVARAVPAAGTRALRGTQVDLVVSTGLPRVPPIRRGSPVGQARADLAAMQLIAVFDPGADRYDDVIRPGAVLGTDPAAGVGVRIGGRVTVIRSLGPTLVAVPQVSGKTLEDAQNALLAAGFTVGPLVTEFDSTLPDGSLVGSRPGAGVLVPKGTSVSLVAVRTLLVPPTQGRTVSEATASLTAAGFTVRPGDPVFDPDAVGGTVSGTVPSAGTRVDLADPVVSVHVSTAVTVPALTGGTVGDAGRQLSGLGLQILVVAMVGHDGSRVVSQSPGAGSRVAPGSQVGVSAFP